MGIEDKANLAKTGETFIFVSHLAEISLGLQSNQLNLSVQKSLDTHGNELMLLCK